MGGPRPENLSTKVIKKILVTFKPKTHEQKMQQVREWKNLLSHINKAIVRLTQQEEADKDS